MRLPCITEWRKLGPPNTLKCDDCLFKMSRQLRKAHGINLTSLTLPNDSSVVDMIPCTRFSSTILPVSGLCMVDSRIPNHDADMVDSGMGRLLEKSSHGEAQFRNRANAPNRSRPRTATSKNKSCQRGRDEQTRMWLPLQNQQNQTDLLWNDHQYDENNLPALSFAKIERQQRGKTAKNEPCCGFHTNALHHLGCLAGNATRALIGPATFSNQWNSLTQIMRRTWCNIAQGQIIIY